MRCLGQGRIPILEPRAIPKLPISSDSRRPSVYSWQSFRSKIRCWFWAIVVLFGNRARAKNNPARRRQYGTVPTPNPVCQAASVRSGGSETLPPTISYARIARAQYYDPGCGTSNWTVGFLIENRPPDVLPRRSRFDLPRRLAVRRMLPIAEEESNDLLCRNRILHRRWQILY